MTIFRTIAPTILFSILCLATVTAEAESPQTCDALNHVVEIVSNHQKLRYQRTLNLDLTELAYLKTSLEVASQNFDLLMNTNEDNLYSENAVIKRYLTDLRHAVSDATTKDTAEALYQKITPDLIPNLNSLNAYWKCSSDKENALIGETSPPIPIRRYGAQTQKTGQFIKGNKAPDFEKVQGQAQQPNGRTLNRVAFNSVNPEQQMTVFLILIGALALIFGTIVYQNRKQQFEIREERTIIQFPLNVRIRNIEHLVHLADISMNGAKLKHSEIFATNDRIHIQIGNEWHAGQIKWSNDTFAGVMFKTPLDAETLHNIS